MAQPKAAQHAPRAIPGKISGQLQERDGPVGEVFDDRTADHAHARRRLGKISGSGKLDQGRGGEGEIGQQLPETESVEKSLSVQRASRLKIGRFGFAAPTRPARKIADTIIPIAAGNVERLIRPLRGEGQVLHFVGAALQAIGVQSCLGPGGLELGKVARKFYLQRRRFPGKLETAQLVCDALDEQHPLIPILLGEFVGRLVIVAFDQLAGRGNAHAAKHSFSLADIDLLRREIDMRTELGDPRVRRRGSREPGRNRQLCAADIERIQERLMMEERGVIDIQRDLADDREGVLAILEIENPDVLGDQAADRIERQPAHRGFDAPLVKFFDDAVTPLPAEPALRQIPSAPGQRADGHEEKKRRARAPERCAFDRRR